MKVRVLNKQSTQGTTKDGRAYTKWTFETGDGKTATTFTDLSQVPEGGEIEGNLVTKEFGGKTYLNFYPEKKSGSSPMFEILNRLEGKIDKLQESVNALGVKAAQSSNDIEAANEAIASAVEQDKEEISMEDIPF